MPAAVVQGHLNYFAITDNTECCQRFLFLATRILFKWLNRRSQRSRLTWERFHALLEQFPLPKPRITVQIWGKQP